MNNLENILDRYNLSLVAFVQDDEAYIHHEDCEGQVDKNIKAALKAGDLRVADVSDKSVILVVA